MLTESTKTKVVGVDIAHENTTYAIVDVRGNILAYESFPTVKYPDIKDFVSHLCDAIVAFVEQQCGYENVRSVGVSIHGANHLTGVILPSTHTLWNEEFPLAAMMRDRLGLAVTVANAPHVRALCEYTYGSAHGMNDFIIVSIGHGLGSCMYSNGRVYLGNNGHAGEIGHVCVDPNGRQCGCGRRGCLETYCSVRGILMTARELMAESDKPSLMREHADDLTTEMIVEFCEKGDELAIETYRRTGEVLGNALANYVSTINPEAVIFTGGVAKAGKWLMDPTDEALEAHVFHNVEGKVKLIMSQFNDVDRDLLGASALAWSVKEYSLFK